MIVIYTPDSHGKRLYVKQFDHVHNTVYLTSRLKDALAFSEDSTEVTAALHDHYDIEFVDGENGNE